MSKQEEPGCAVLIILIVIIVFMTIVFRSCSSGPSESESRERKRIVDEYMEKEVAKEMIKKHNEKIDKERKENFKQLLQNMK